MLAWLQRQRHVSPASTSLDNRWKGAYSRQVCGRGQYEVVPPGAHWVVLPACTEAEQAPSAYECCWHAQEHQQLVPACMSVAKFEHPAAGEQVGAVSTHTADCLHSSNQQSLQGTR